MTCRAISRPRPLVAFLALILLLALAPGGRALAVEPDEILPDAAMEARARALSLELRCLVCQNQSIDDSNAPLARDLRLLVRERLKSGDTDAQVMSFIVARYGDFVLLRPPLNWKTLLLWLSAPVLLIVVGTMLWRAMPVRGGGRPELAATSAPLTADERAALDRLLADGDEATSAAPPAERGAG